MIINEQQLNKFMRKKLKEGEKPKDIKLIMQFVKDFNKEARRQNSKWYAELQYNEFPHISKRLESGWWIFKEMRVISFQVRECGGYFDFVDNDYICGPAGKEFSDRFFKCFPEFKEILEKIPENIFILEDNSFETLNNNLHEITERITKIGKKIK